MKLEDFMYKLPDSLIAACPTRERAASRLLVVQRDSGQIIHSVFAELANFLAPGDLLVLNDTKVFPARLPGTKESGGKAEVLLLERFPGRRSLWIALIEAAKKPRVGSRIYFRDNLVAEVIGDLGRGRFGLEFDSAGDFANELDPSGEPPLPLYIRRNRKTTPVDWQRYQTVYAANPGAIAAPTAGFHFTQELLDELGAKGIDRALLTLHVGPGTFLPVRAENVENHRMEGERYALSTEAAEKIKRTKSSRHRVVAVGSTSTRALEWIALQKGSLQPDEGIARLFIHPGDSFRVVDALITNFHLPGSTPLMLVAAFAGLELVRRAYEEAIRLQYRFYSYGDAMLVL
jgi:S-adenosylmethionine:tRNA ribosyltransferase-isomerase